MIFLEYEEAKKRVQALAAEVKADLDRYAEIYADVKLRKDFVEGYVETVYRSIEGCNFFEAALNLGYLATEADRIYDATKGSALAGKLAALYTLLCIMLAASVKRCAIGEE